MNIFEKPAKESKKFCIDSNSLSIEESNTKQLQFLFNHLVPDQYCDIIYFNITSHAPPIAV